MKLSDVLENPLVQAGIGYLGRDLGDADIDPQTYQGSIEPKTRFRRQVKDTRGPVDKLAGAKARRYFTDSVFAKDPEAVTDLVQQEAVLDQTYFTPGAEGEEGTYQTFTADVLGDFLAEQQLGTKVFTDTGRVQVDGADQDQVIDFATEVLEADKDESTTYHEADGKFYPVLKPDLYDSGKIYDAGGFEIDPSTMKDPTKDYTAEGFEILQADERAGKNVNPEGFEILNYGQAGTQSELIASMQDGINPVTGKPFIFDDQGRVVEQEAKMYDVGTAIEQGLADQAAEISAGLGGLGYTVDPTTPYGVEAFGGISPFRTRDPSEFATTVPFSSLYGNMQAQAPVSDITPYTGGLMRRDADSIANNAKGGQIKGYAMGGGVQQLAGGRYLNGMTDGMADKVPSSIEGTQPAALSDGEFVIPADVVSHLGNGSSNAGAKVLDDMMSNVRKARTGNPNQGKQINPKQVMAQGGIAGFKNGGLSSLVNSKGPVRNFSGNEDGSDPNLTTPDPDMGLGPQTGTTTSLNPLFGDYVTDMLGDAAAIGDTQYEGYLGYGGYTDDQGNEIAGDISAGASDLQRQAFASAADMDTSGAGLGSFGNLTQEQLTGFMNPYLQGALAPQLREAKRQADIQRMENQARMTQAGSFGGSRQAIMDMANRRDLNQQMADITAKGYNEAFQQARDQFGEDRQFGLDALQRQAEMGQTARDIYQDAIDADRAAFEEARDFDSNKLQFQLSMLQGMPLAAQDYSYAQASDLQKTAGFMSDFNKFLESDFYKDYLGSTPATPTTTPPATT